jgi:acetolactate synthase small subunit
MDRRFEKLDDIFKEELFSESDLAKVNKIIEAITDSFSELDRKIGNARISALGVDLKEVEEAAEALNKLRKEIIQVKEQSAASILGNDSEKLKAFVKVSQKTGFKGGESYKKNIDNLKASGEKAET